MPNQRMQFLNLHGLETLRQYVNGMQYRHCNAFRLNDFPIAQFFIVQSDLSEQRERLIRAMSRSAYETLTTQYHDLSC